jgi:hypothetical protein
MFLPRPPDFLPFVLILLSAALLNGCAGLMGSRTYCEQVAQQQPPPENEQAMKEWKQVMDNCSDYLYELDRDEDNLIKQDMDSRGRPLPHR